MIVFSPARQQFYTLVRQTPINLAAAALAIAQEEYPQLDAACYLHQLDTMAEAVQTQLPETNYPLRLIQTLNHYLFDEWGFRGNADNYYDPRNSFLSDVLERRTGIPITLSLVYLELAQRIGFPMVGVNFPGHFLIRPQRDDLEFFVDPFHQGDILFHQDCQERLAALYGQAIPLQPQFFTEVTPTLFLVRMLTNLKQIYLHRQDFDRCLAASERILLVQPNHPIERRDRGLLYYQLERWSESRQDLEDYLAQTPTPEDQALIQKLLSQLDELLESEL